MHRFFIVVVIATAVSFSSDFCDACDQCDRAAAQGTSASGRHDAAERQQEQQPARPSLLIPGNTYVRVRLGSYRLSSNYAGGDGGIIAAEADEAEVISPDVNPGLNFARELRDKRDQRMHEDVATIFEKPFTKVVTETRVVTVQQPCPQPAPYCAGVRRPYCSGLRGYAAPAYAAQHSCSCNGVGCTYCRGPVSTAAYGRCAAWRYVRGTPLSCYRDPPSGREFWCNCTSHQGAVSRMYGRSTVWQLVPCMCAAGCTQCGGSGRCGTH